MKIDRKTNLSFAEFIKAHRLGEELSQEEFAKVLKVPKRRLADIENDMAELIVADAKSIAHKLGVPAKWLVRLAIRDQLRRENIHLSVT